MLVDVLVPSKIDLKPGDRVEFDHTYETRRNGMGDEGFCNYGEVRC